MSAVVCTDVAGRPHASMPEPDLRSLFHRLNNQLGTILAHAELLESKAPSDAERRRAAQIVARAVVAMTATREIREHAVDAPLET